MGVRATGCDFYSGKVTNITVPSLHRTFTKCVYLADPQEINCGSESTRRRMQAQRKADVACFNSLGCSELHLRVLHMSVKSTAPAGRYPEVGQAAQCTEFDDCHCDALMPDIDA
jgi:hypothetical protein